MNKKIFIFILSLIVFSSIVLASNNKVIQIRLEVYKDDQVTVKEFRITEGRERLPFEERGDYKYQLLTKNNEIIDEKNFELSFMMFTDPPKFLDKTILNLRLPYSDNIHKFILYHNDKNIFERKIIEVVCGDNECDKEENFISCPSDCPSSSKDGYCDKILDGKCDPDCAGVVDIDCTCGNSICEEQESEKTCPEDCKKTEPIETNHPIAFIIGAIILLIIGYITIKKKFIKS